MITYDRVTKRMQIIEETGLEHYEILLDSDREQEAFDSKNLYDSIQKLSVADQKKIQLGMQWLGSFDGFNPVLIGDFAKAFYTTEPVELPTIAEYVLDSRFEKLIRSVEKESFKSKNVAVSFLDSGIEVLDYGCRIFNRDANRKFEDSVLNAEYKKVFGFAVKVESK